MARAGFTAKTATSRRWSPRIASLTAVCALGPLIKRRPKHFGFSAKSSPLSPLEPLPKNAGCPGLLTRSEGWRPGLGAYSPSKKENGGFYVEGLVDYGKRKRVGAGHRRGGAGRR